MGANNEFQKIDLNDYIQTGEGGTALAYTHRNGKSLAKLYNPDFDADTMKNEFWASRTAFELGISTPAPFRLITDGKRFGSEYELIEGKRSFSRIISQEPKRLEEISLEFARMARELHATKADTSRLKSYKQAITQFYSEKDFVPGYYRNRILKFLDKVPDTESCLHGDLQIGNAITDGKRALWIDLGGFGYGAPEWDLALMWNLAHMPDADKLDFLFHLPSETMKIHWNIFFSAYLGTNDKQQIEEATRRLPLFAAAKIPYMFGIAFHKNVPEEFFVLLSQLLDQSDTGKE
jgi:uncharacterized protein (TIGR02172 family)